MQYTTPGETWAGWLAANDDRDDDTKLAALREIIAYDARQQVERGECKADWANKKLAKLGITDPVPTTSRYELEVPVTGTLRLSIVAASRAAALAEFSAGTLSGMNRSISDVLPTSDPTFISGPEDGVGVISPDAPTTVGATLETLREVIMLGVIAGPKFCVGGANRVLSSYGLAPLPPIKEYVVTRPVQATARTVVEAYDEDSAERVAGWRWDDNRAAHTLVDPAPAGAIQVVPNCCS